MDGFHRCMTIRDLRNAARKALDVITGRDRATRRQWMTPGTPFYTAFSELDEAVDHFDQEGAHDLHRIFAHYHPELAAATGPPGKVMRVVRGSYTPPRNQIPPPPARKEAEADAAHAHT